jgi:hypothetical protein
VDVAAKNKRLLPFRQQIAMIAAHGGDQKLPPSDPAATGFDGFARVGHAEGFARKGEFDAAMKLVQAPGSGKDRLDAALGAGAVFLETDKLKAAAFVGEAFKILGEKKIESTISEWQFLQLVKLAARTDKMDLAKNLAKLLSRDFAMRAHLEIFLATVDATNGFMEAEGLDEIENPDKKAPAKKEATAGDTIVLAWLAIARHNAQAGYGREATRRLLEERLKTWTPPGGEADVLRAIIDVGAYQGAKK